MSVFCVPFHSTLLHCSVQYSTCTLACRSNTSISCELRSIALTGAARVSVHFDDFEIPFLEPSGARSRELPYTNFTFYPPVSNIKLVKHTSILRYCIYKYPAVLLLY